MDVLVAYKSASDATVQLITLATGILALSITFMRDVVKSNKPTWALKSGWVVLLLSVIFGVWTMLGITGSLFRVTILPEQYGSAFPGSNIRIPSALQVLAFVTGIFFLVFYCVRSIKPKKRKSPRAMWSRLKKAK